MKTTSTRDIKSGEVQKKIVEADAKGQATKEVVEKISKTGEVEKETKVVKADGKIETTKEKVDKITGKN